MKKILNFSLLYGLISLIMLLLEVFVLQNGIWFSMLAGIIMTIIFAFGIGFYERSKRGGYITYIDAVKFLFVVLAIGTLFSFIGSFVVMKLDPGIVDYFVESTIESTRELSRKMGESPIQLEEELLTLEEELKYKIQGLGLFINMISNALMKIFYALIISIFIKKEQLDFKS